MRNTGSFICGNRMATRQVADGPSEKTASRTNTKSGVGFLLQNFKKPSASRPTGNTTRRQKSVGARSTRRVKAPSTPKKLLKTATRGIDVKRVPKSRLRIEASPSNIAALVNSMIDSSVHSMSMPDVSPKYFLADRKGFVEATNKMFDQYAEEIREAAKNVSCDNYGASTDLSLLPHQKIVRDYLNLNTPYRGLLLYHGLGSGKTCSSIAIAEGMKSNRKVVVLTPASLQKNYVEELKKCGSALYARTQHWTKVQARSPAEASSVSTSLRAPLGKGGFYWIMDPDKPSNYGDLLPEEQKEVDKQLNSMIETDYRFIRYNGLKRDSALIRSELDPESGTNPFDNCTVVIDEAHNLSSRISNSLKLYPQSKRTPGINDPAVIAYRLYHGLLSAKNARMILLTGTPIINSPHEIGILFNIIRGYMKVWTVPVSVPESMERTKFSEDVTRRLDSSGLVDYLSIGRVGSGRKSDVSFSRNPIEFVRTAGSPEVSRNEEENIMNDAAFVKNIVAILGQKPGYVVGKATEKKYKALPDSKDEFDNMFIEYDDEDAKWIVRNRRMFQSRILGLGSYFKSAQETLMPAFEKETDFHLVKEPMSDYQFKQYATERELEKQQELRNASRRRAPKKPRKSGTPPNPFEMTASSTYRIFSRAFCNFVFPENIVRPRPDHDKKQVKGSASEEGESETAKIEFESAKEVVEAEKDGTEDVDGSAKNLAYLRDLEDALTALWERREESLVPGVPATADTAPTGLHMYSPKFLRMLQNVSSEDQVGLHLVYSQFKTLEGTGIFALVLRANGFAQFKIKQVDGVWELDVPLADQGKPLYALYTGSEGVEEREILRNVFNGAWDALPKKLSASVEELAKKARESSPLCRGPNEDKVDGLTNHYGAAIKTFMITASGAEGISLKNVRYVHITESYWHPVRIEQVIGRARRICSHEALPEEEKNVSVYLYLMEISERQIEANTGTGDGQFRRLIASDTSRSDPQQPVTSDEALYEIALEKSDIVSSVLGAVQESSIDCSVHRGKNCLSYRGVPSSDMSFVPDYEEEIAVPENRKAEESEMEVLLWKGKQILYDRSTDLAYDLDTYNLTGNLVPV